MNRRGFLSAMGAAAMQSNAQLPARPNIILIVVDDMGYGDVAALGNKVVKTPNLNWLHAESVRFTDFHVSPTCAPTRTSIMTGRHEFKSGVTHTILERERMSLKATTIAQVLQSAGYATGIFGKWHLGDDAPHQPGKRGFDEVFIHGCGGIGQDYPGTCSDAPGNTYFDPTILHNGVFERTKGYCTDVFFTQAMKWVESKRGAGKPFFTYITPNSPHAPLICPEEYRRMYDGLNLPENTQKYFGMVTNVDDNVGRLMSRLNQFGLDENTLLIFMTDNGGTGGVRVFNAGMRGQKGTPYMGGTRVPAFFRWKGTLKPRDIDKLTAHVDYFATFAELAGAKVPDGIALDGRSLIPLLRDANAVWPDRYLFTHVGRWANGKGMEAKYRNCSVRNTRYNMVRTAPDKPWELYEVIADPGEKTDVAAKLPDVVAKMNAVYDQWWAEVLPLTLENEQAKPPRVAPYKTLYWNQYGGGPGTAPGER
ncbi:MAG: arylsulfatase [Acidobacteria bacterium]|nr:arylsulfatase [Acidobacteriota bacterium]